MEIDEVEDHEEEGEEEAMMNMFASVWVKTEVVDADGNIEEDNLNDLDYEPPGIMDSKRGTRKRKGYKPRKTMKCDKCDYTTVYRNCLELHVRSHTTPKPYACLLCSYTSKYPTSLNRHVLVHHQYEKEGKEADFKCPICEYKTHYKWNLYAHTRKHKIDKQFHCEHCPYATSYKHNYLKHAKVHNKKEIKFKCDKCPFITKFEGHITRHLAKIHNEVLDKAKKCDYCDFSTLTGWRLNIHKQRSRQEVLLKCAYCDFETNYRCEIKKHKITHYNQLYNYKEVNSYDLVDGKVQATKVIESLSNNTEKNPKNDKQTYESVSEGESNTINNIKQYKLNTVDGVNADRKLSIDILNTDPKLNTDANDLNLGINDLNIGHKMNTDIENLKSKMSTDYNILNNTKDFPTNIDYNIQILNTEFTSHQYRNDPVTFSDLNYSEINYNMMYTDTNCATNFKNCPTEKEPERTKQNEPETLNEKNKNYHIDSKHEVDWNSIQVLESDNKDRAFQCVQCKYTSKFKASVQRHFQRHHTGNQHRPYKCVRCEFSTKTKDQIALHNKRSQCETPIQCNSCEYTTNYKCQFVEHQRTHYAHKCNICNYSCKHKFEIQRHFVSMHLDGGIKCRFCDFKATRKESILCHETIHTGNKPFKCNLCTYSSVRKCLLDIHFRKYHSDVKKEVVVVPESKIDTLKVLIDIEDQSESVNNGN
ncbi:hypothetical protein K1T71_000994 [Dendrolimus kikuchii]|uniref:Uncharacterized protein n=1 Tax=Dendrolimus kikuchii TaxID=765133 RepID=A0ACC1DGD4_9NEOP|nr:hypothetical protein K1T71_000994 [Dendrolimus kikuchii]